LIAAEKSRDWQSGQVLDSTVDQTTKVWGSVLNQKTALVSRQVYTITASDKNYLVTGSIARKQALTVGAIVRFAVDDKIMFVSLANKEYRFSVLEEKVASSRDPESLSPSVARNRLPDDEAEPLDNDAVVKMVVGGLKEDTVVRVVEARPGQYVLAPDAMLALRAAGVPQSVITAMSAKMSVQH
jgi:hypothetical protein